MATATVQMNIRLNKELKDRGDEAFANAGYSPSEAVRDLWSFAARHQESPQAIRQHLGHAEPETAAEDSAERKRKLDSMHATQQRMTELFGQLSVHPSPSIWNRPYEELREEALLERMRERGLDA